MRHVVVNEKVICSKCLKMHMGATVSILDFYACPDCFYKKYQPELEPILTKMVREYFQPERSKREDLERGCGALNTMET
jgi:hypothetical protein